MRQPPRRIHIAGQDYLWIVGRRHRADDVYPGHVCLKVFSAVHRGRQRLEVRVRFDDPWLNYGPMLTTPADRFDAVWALQPITPGLVAQIVGAAVGLGFRADQPGPPLRCHWDGARLVQAP